MKTINKELDRLEKLYMMPTGLKGIQRSSNDLQSTLRGGGSSIGASDGAPNQAAQRAMAKMEKETKAVLEQINTFMEGDFADFKQQVEGLDFSLFKKYEPIKLDRQSLI